MAEPGATKVEMQAWAAETVTRREYATLMREQKLAMFEEWCNAKLPETRERIYGDMMGLTRFTLLLKKMADDRVIDYAVRIVRATRNWPGIEVGAGPRGSLALVRAARAVALLHGRDFITPDDVAAQARAVLRHRVTMAPDAQIEGRDIDELLQAALESVEAPRL